jgi:hypothetical protein
MKNMSAQTKQILDELKRTLVVFDETSAQRKLDVIQKCSHLNLSNPKFLLQYHNALLFALGYSENEMVYVAVENEMERLSDSVKKLSSDKKEILDRSGVAFSETQGAYSLTLVKWLLERYPDQIAIHSFDEEGTHPKEVLKYVLPEMEFEITSDEKLKPVKWLEKVSGIKKRNDLLKWLIKHIDKVNASDLIKDQLFESLQLFINIKPQEKEFSRTFGNFSFGKNFYHPHGLLRKFDERELINRKLPQPKKLLEKEKNVIIERSRVALCLLNRETDPITYCNADGLLVYELEHGLSIALFSMLPGRRLPLESYIGFMMFKNGYPMAYGGGWLFGNRSLLGINIFEAFRGGESAFVFCQLLRSYKQNFGANYFEVEPYQFGKDNPEGLQSGAFWFYYRFGFKPVDEALNKLALEEADKIKNTKGYRTSIDTLKQFTKSNIHVNFEGNEKPINPTQISKYITEKIAKDFSGDRIAAEKFCLKIIAKELGVKKPSAGLKKLSLFIGLCIDFKKVTASEKNTLKELLLEKGNSEFKYIALCKAVNFKKILL